MRNKRPKYMCFPSVVCVGQEAEIAVVPRDIGLTFREETKYELEVLGLQEDMGFHYAHPLKYDHPYRIEGGCLYFTCQVDREQEYRVRLKVQDGGELILGFYGVKEDLYRLRPLKGDMHCHSYYSDGSDSIPMVPANFREEGFDFVALTDHNRMYPSELAAKLFQDIPLGMCIMRGEEIHTPGSSVHIVHVGGKTSVADLYVHGRDQYEKEVDAIEGTLLHVEETYRRRTAMAKWACEKIRQAEGLSILAHPFWLVRNYNLSEDFREILYKECRFDALEMIAGMSDRINNLQLVFWQEQCMKGNILPVVGNSDAHVHDFESNRFGKRFTIVFARENTTEAILEAIRAGYSVACELPEEGSKNVRIYGLQLRLVAFAHFLFTNYFEETRNYCAGEGMLMRRYVQGEPVGEVLAALSHSVEDFYRKFYGLDPRSMISKECTAFLEECRQAQLRGPLTKGGDVDTRSGITRRI